MVLGAAVMARRRANEDIVGKVTVEAALEKVAPEIRSEWDGLHALSWISLEDVEAIQDAIAVEARRDPEELHDAVIRASVERALKGLYRMVLRYASDEWLVAQTAAIFRHTRKRGDLSSTIPEPGRAELSLTGWRGIRDRHVRQVAIGVERVLTLSGRRDVRVESQPAPDGATFVVTWRGDHAPSESVRSRPMP